MTDPVQCPFLKQQCLLNRCELYGGMTMTRPGRVVGSFQKQDIKGCVFNIIALLLADPRPMPMPPLRPAPNRPN